MLAEIVEFTKETIGIYPFPYAIPTRLILAQVGARVVAEVATMVPGNLPRPAAPSRRHRSALPVVGAVGAEPPVVAAAEPRVRRAERPASRNPSSRCSCG